MEFIGVGEVSILSSSGRTFRCRAGWVLKVWCRISEAKPGLPGLFWTQSGGARPGALGARAVRNGEDPTPGSRQEPCSLSDEPAGPGTRPPSFSDTPLQGVWRWR